MEGKVVYGDITEPQERTIRETICVRNKKNGELSEVDTDKLAMLLLDKLKELLEEVCVDRETATNRLIDILGEYGVVYEAYDKYKTFCAKREEIRKALKEFVAMPNADEEAECEAFADKFEKVIKIVEELL